MYDIEYIKKVFNPGCMEFHEADEFHKQDIVRSLLKKKAELESNLKTASENCKENERLREALKKIADSGNCTGGWMGGCGGQDMCVNIAEDALEAN